MKNKEINKHKRYESYMDGWTVGASGEMHIDDMNDYDKKLGYADGRKAFKSARSEAIEYYTRKAEK